jgi:hypothetical protein
MAAGVAVRGEEADGKSPCFVITANHVLVQMKGDSCALVSRFAREDRMYQRQEIQIPIRKDGKSLWKKHATEDLAVLPLPDSVDIEALPLDSLATETSLADVHSGDAVRLAVFPERLEANPAGFPILRIGSLASYPIVPVKLHPVFLVDATAWTGDSGGPVMHATLRSPSGGPLVLGIVRGMRAVFDTTKESRFVERRTTYPLGISEVLHVALAHKLISEPATEQ